MTRDERDEVWVVLIVGCWVISAILLALAFT